TCNRSHAMTGIRPKTPLLRSHATQVQVPGDPQLQCVVAFGAQTIGLDRIMVQVTELYVPVAIDAPAERHVKPVLIENIGPYVLPELAERLMVQREEGAVVQKLGARKWDRDEEPVAPALTKGEARMFEAVAIDHRLHAFQPPLFEPVAVLEVQAAEALHHDH